MIPLELQSALKERMEEHFKNFLLGSPGTDQVPLKVFEQHLEAKPSSDISQYPYLLIRVSEATPNGQGEGHTLKIMFIAGVFDESNNNQGYKDAITILNKVLAHFIKYPLVEKRFEFDPENWNWSYPDDDVAPYFLCGLETNWKIPQPLREDVEAII